MASRATRSGVGGTTVPDYLDAAANVVYGVAGVLFLAGLYYDWQHTGEVLIAQFALADEPNANSGLFILSIIVLVFGYLLSVAGDKLDAYQTEQVDQTQEWTVDVGEDN